MKKYTALLLSLLIFCQLGGYRAASLGSVQLQEEIAGRAAFLISQVTTPTIGSVGGEWAVFALARGNQTVPSGYFDGYYTEVEKTLTAMEGNLSSTKYTEYSRVIIALSATQKDVTNVAGFNLLEKISDLEKVKKQGINGPIFALIAFDTKNYEIPLLSTNQTQVTRAGLIDYILSREVTDNGITGGFSLSGGVPDPDITAMALQALAPYREERKVALAIDRGIFALQRMQQTDGGYASMNGSSTEGAAQVVVALCTLGINPDNTPAFTKTDELGNPHTPISFLTEEYEKAKMQGSVSLMSTEQTLYALVAYDRFLQGKNSLYDMTREIPESEGFFDIAGHWAKTSIEATKGFGITNGRRGAFLPDLAITRAEFAAAVANAFSLTAKQGDTTFSDVEEGVWYQKMILACADCGIVKGKGEGLFDPEGSITRQEAMAMIQRTAQYFGRDTSMSLNDISSLLARYEDGPLVAWWAMGPAGFNLKEGIILGKDGKIAPLDPITRGETVVVVERLLQKLDKSSSYQ